jgi:sugar lactone lactonase YvrE
VQRGRRRRLFFLISFFVVTFSAICVVTVLLVRDAILGDRREPVAVLTGARVFTLAELPGERAYPEALTVGPDNAIYVGSFCTGDIWRVTPTGERTLYFDGDDGIGAASGLAFAPDGSLYVADRGDCDPRSGTASIKRILPDASAAERVGDIDSEDIPNALAFDAEGILYLTDTQHGNVRYLTEAGQFDTWWALPDVDGEDARPTGLAYDPATDSLLVADTQSGTIYRVGFDVNRQATQEEVLYRQGTRDLDGLTVDPAGRIYVTLFNLHKVALFQEGFGLTILAEDFREPSDVAYLDGVIYVTNFDSVSLAPIISWIIDPSLPFTVDAIELPEELQAGVVDDN